MLELITLLAALVLCVWTPIEARKVRSGWMRKNFKGGHAEFVAKYRHQLAVMGWVGLALGILNIGLGALAANEASLVVKLVVGGLWIVGGVVSFASRRLLNAPRTA